MEAEIVSLRKYVHKKNIHQNFINNTIILDGIISSQIPCDEKYGLGYKPSHVEKGSSSMTAGKEAEHKSYSSVIKDSIKKEEHIPSKVNHRRKNQQSAVKRTQHEAYKRFTP